MCNNKIIDLRAHHLLCSVLFEGKGYSDSFTKNMTQIVNGLKEEDNYLKLRTSRDIICGDCPNLKEDGGCTLDDKIPDLDQHVIDFFELSTDEKLLSGEVFRKIKEKITPEFFSYCCDECRWKKLGICTYEKYINNLDNFM